MHHCIVPRDYGRVQYVTVPDARCDGTVQDYSGFFFYNQPAVVDRGCWPLLAAYRRCPQLQYLASDRSPRTHHHVYFCYLLIKLYFYSTLRLLIFMLRAGGGLDFRARPCSLRSLPPRSSRPGYDIKYINCNANKLLGNACASNLTYIWK